MGNTISRTQIFNLTLITGLAFMVGGVINYPLSYLAYGEASAFMTILSIVLRYLVQAIIGCFALAWQLRQQYPFKKLWLMGVSSIILGILIPAILMNQFFYALLVFPGLLIGLAFGMFLWEIQAVWIMIATCSISMLIANIYYMGTGASLQSFNVWFIDKFGQYWTSNMLIEAIPNFLLGAGIALGVGLVLRKREKDGGSFHRNS